MYVAMLKLVMALIIVWSLLHLRPRKPFPLREKFMYVTRGNIYIDVIHRQGLQVLFGHKTCSGELHAGELWRKDLSKQPIEKPMVTKRHGRSHELKKST